MIELQSVHLSKDLHMPGGTTEILHRGEKRGIETKIFLDDKLNLVLVQRILDSGDTHERLVPLSNIQSMEKYGRQAEEEGAAGSSKQPGMDTGEAAAGRGGNQAKTRKRRSKVEAS